VTDGALRGKLDYLIIFSIHCFTSYVTTAETKHKSNLNKQKKKIKNLSIDFFSVQQEILSQNNGCPDK